MPRHPRPLGLPLRLLTASALLVAALSSAAGPAFAVVSSPGTPAPAPETIRPELVPGVERLTGADRYEVSAAISKSTYPDGTGVNTVYVVSGEGYADALSASALGGLTKSPVLLVKRDEVPPAIRYELSRLQPVRIHIVGGLNSVGPAAEAELRKFAPTLSRVDGRDRYEVSAGATAYAMPGPAGAPVVYVASGEKFPDALSGSAAAGRANGPVLLVREGEVPGPVLAEIKRLHPRAIVALGGTSTISDATLGELKTIAPTTRIGGADRYEVSAATAAPFPDTTDTVYVASGEKFPDALSGGAAAVVDGSPLLLVTSTSIPDAVARQLDRIRPARVVVLGGTSTIDDTVAEQLKSHLG